MKDDAYLKEFNGSLYVVVKQGNSIKVVNLDTDEIYYIYEDGNVFINDDVYWMADHAYQYKGDNPVVAEVRKSFCSNN